MVPPKPRTISLEPISRKTKKRRSTKKEKEKERESGLQDTAEMGSGNEPVRATTSSPLPDDSASQCDSTDHTSPKSPVPSDVQSTVSADNSAGSTVSSSTGLSFRVATGSAKSKDDSQGSRGSLKDQTITATIELLKSGCLPGDNVPLKISIKHTKAIRSMHGVIITLYRQGRIDSAPPLSLFADIKGKEAEKLKHEEYYPKSKTGLGGLSLTSAGSSSMFRKDLAQTFAPILVDPVTLTSVIHASIRVPEDVFPTISGVPGQMITFKYNVEVVVDLGGKLAGQQRHIPRLGQVSLPSSFVSSAGARGDSNPNMLAAWGGSIVGTENIRREKSVVACLFEVTVGSIDSARNRVRGNSNAVRPPDDWADTSAMNATSNGPIYEESTSHDTENHGHMNGDQPYSYDESENHYHEYYPENGYHYDDFYQDQYPPPAHSQIPVPLPDLHVDHGLSDKERAKRAEERLLPSRPPVDGAGPSTSVAVPSAPSAPMEAEEDLYSPDDVTPQASRPNGHHSNPIATAPSLDDLGPPSRSNTTDDKQELERQRLMAEASEPSYPPDTDDHGEGSSAPPAATAPVLSDDDGYGGHYSHHDLPGPSQHREVLPKYEK